MSLGAEKRHMHFTCWPNRFVLPFLILSSSKISNLNYLYHSFTFIRKILKTKGKKSDSEHVRVIEGADFVGPRGSISQSCIGIRTRDTWLGQCKCLKRSFSFALMMHDA